MVALPVLKVHDGRQQIPILILTKLKMLRIFFIMYIFTHKILDTKWTLYEDKAENCVLPQIRFHYFTKKCKRREIYHHPYIRLFSFSFSFHSFHVTTNLIKLTFFYFTFILITHNSNVHFINGHKWIKYTFLLICIHLELYLNRKLVSIWTKKKLVICFVSVLEKEKVHIWCK